MVLEVCSLLTVMCYKSNFYISVYSLCILILRQSVHLCVFRSVVVSHTRWLKYDRDYLCVKKSQFVPVIFEPPCIKRRRIIAALPLLSAPVSGNL
jgi:hypothetical protein